MNETEHVGTPTEAEDSTRRSMKRKGALSPQVILSTYLPALIFALGTGIALPAIPGLARSFHVSFSLATGVTTSFLVGAVIATIPSGWMIDRFGRRRLMLAGPMLTAAMAFLVVTAHNFPQLLVYRFFDGAASQIWLICRLAGITREAPPEERGRRVTWMFGMDSTGRLFGPLVGGFIATTWGLRAPFVAYGFLSLLALIPGFLYITDTPRREKRADGERQKRTISLRKIIVPRIAYFGVSFFASLTRGPSTAGLLNLYAAFAYGIVARQIGYLAAAAASVSLPLSFAAGWMLDRFGRKATMVPAFLGTAVTSAGLALIVLVHLSLFWYVALFLLNTGVQALTGGSIQTVGADVAPPEARGLFLGLFRFTGQGGSALSPIIFALLAATVGYAAGFFFIALCAATVGFILIFFVPEKDGMAETRTEVTTG